MAFVRGGNKKQSLLVVDVHNLLYFAVKKPEDNGPSQNLTFLRPFPLLFFSPPTVVGIGTSFLSLATSVSFLPATSCAICGCFAAVAAVAVVVGAINPAAAAAVEGGGGAGVSSLLNFINSSVFLSFSPNFRRACLAELVASSFLSASSADGFSSFAALRIVLFGSGFLAATASA
jgi:hypothetical protein